MNRSMSFCINDASTGGTNPAVFITITENDDGTLRFSLVQEGGIVGDLRGLFFDVADESLIGSLRTDALTTDFRQGDDTIRDLGDGANMNGLTGSDKGYDAGIEIGSSGIGRDDVRSYSFNLASTARSLTLDDFANVNFGVRLTSVGVVDGSRADSSKLLETTSAAIDASDDAAAVFENEAFSGSLLDNDANQSGATTITSWSGGELGQAVQLADAAGATLLVNADGSYSLDASTADALSEGETLTYSFDYGVRSDSPDQTSSDSAYLGVTVVGRNDGPVAGDDAAGPINENEVLAGNVTGNDGDVDRLDSHAWALVDGSFSGLGSLVFNADGTWSYDAAGAYDGLNDGEIVDLSFAYTMTDNHGASDAAVVTFSVVGTGTSTPQPPGDHFPTFDRDISHVTLYFATEQGDVKPAPDGDGIYTVKIDNWQDQAPGTSDDLDHYLGEIMSWLGRNDLVVAGNPTLMGVAIKGGQTNASSGGYNNFYAIDGNPDADLLPSPLTEVVENRGVDVSYDYWAVL